MTEYVVRIIEIPSDRIQLILAICTFFVALVSIFYTHHSVASQKKHNYLSVVPILHIHCGVYDNQIDLQLINGGLGPAIITKFVIIDNDSQSYHSFLDLIKKSPLQNINFQYYAPKDSPKIILSDERILLFEYNIDKQELNTEKSKKVLNELKKILKKTTVSLSYTNIYDKSSKKKDEKMNKNLSEFFQ